MRKRETVSPAEAAAAAGERVACSHDQVRGYLACDARQFFMLDSLNADERATVEAALAEWPRCPGWRWELTPVLES